MVPSPAALDPFSPQEVADFAAVHAGQHDIQQDQIGRVQFQVAAHGARVVMSSGHRYWFQL